MMNVLLVEDLYYTYPARRNETAVILWLRNEVWSTIPADYDLSAPTAGLLLAVDKEHYQQDRTASGYCCCLRSGLLFRHDFLKNREVLQGRSLPKQWLISEDVTRFYVSDLIAHGVYNQGDQFECRDAQGNICKIDNTAKLHIMEALQGGQITLAVQSPLGVVRVKRDSSDFKNGLTSLVLCKL